MASDANNTAKHEALQPLHPSMAGKLDPAFERLYNDNVAKTPPKPLDLAALRASYSHIYSYARAPAPDVGRVYDDTIPLQTQHVHGGGVPATQLAVRVYQPDCPGPWPVHINFHGGGWAVGDLDSESHLCRHYCRKASVVVVDVAYRLVPEFPFPTAITDGFSALRYVREHGAERFGVRTDSISIGGVSAGGGIALVVAHLARDADISLRLVAVGAPVIDDISKYDTAAMSPWPSMRENEFVPTLNWARLKWFDTLKRSSVSGEAADDVGWFANLLEAPNFRGLSRSIIFTAGADPLRDEGERYAQILVENGVEVLQQRFLEVPHPFMQMDQDLWQAREYIGKMAREIRLAHRDP